MQSRFAAWLFALGIAAGVAPSLAQACSAPSCFEGELFPGDGDLPADRVSFTYRPGGDYYQRLDGGAGLPRLYRLEGDAKVELAFDMTKLDGNSYRLKPTQVIKSGERLVLELDASSNCGQALRQEYRVIEAPPLPTSLGTVDTSTTRGTIEIAQGGSCSAFVDVDYAELTLAVSEQAKPFEALLRYEWIVDGAPHADFRAKYNVFKSLGRGKNRLFTVCHREPQDIVEDLAPGTHRVRVRGVLEDGTVIETPEVEVTLVCDGTAPAPLPDGGTLELAEPSGTPAQVEPSGTGVPGSRTDSGCQLGAPELPAWWMLGTVVLRRRRKKV